jgi:hypothetical protein
MQEPTFGAFQLPFAMTVKPKLVELLAERLPLPFGRMVIALPLSSQVGLPFQVAEIFRGEETVTFTDQLVIGVLPAVTVTWPLKRSPQRVVSA